MFVILRNICISQFSYLKLNYSLNYSFISFFIFVILYVYIILELKIVPFLFSIVWLLMDNFVCSIWQVFIYIFPYFLWRKFFLLWLLFCCDFVVNSLYIHKYQSFLVFFRFYFYICNQNSTIVHYVLIFFKFILSFFMIFF